MRRPSDWALRSRPAKPVIDVQISVTALEPLEPLEPLEAFKDPLEQLGCDYRAGNR